MALRFSQRPDIDYVETYSPVVDAINSRYLMNSVVYENLEMYLMDMITTYLYGSLDDDIFMRIVEGFNVSEEYNGSRETC